MANQRPALPTIELNPTEPQRTHSEWVRLTQQWCHTLLAEDQVVEVRALGVASSPTYSSTWNGYFTGRSLTQLAAESHNLPKNTKGIYFTLNPLKPELLARRINRIAKAGKSDAAADADVIARRWLLIDADPKRASGISATDEEKAHAGTTILAVRGHLHQCGWPEPIAADSGNGFHLLYRIDLPAKDDGLVNRVLESLAAQFDNDQVTIDRSVCNPSRICKLPGTMSRKGDCTEERPHRRSRILHIPQEIQVVSRELLESFTPAPTRHKPSRTTIRKAGSSHRRLDIPRWLTDRGVQFREKPEPESQGRTVYVLAQCPFNPDHADPDASIMQAPDGKPSAHCFHNSCRDKGWHQFKESIGSPNHEHYEPQVSTAQARSEAAAIFAHAHGEPAPRLAESSPRSCPRRIVINDRHLPAITHDALLALADVNDPPKLFQYGGVLTRVRSGDDEDPWRLEPLTTDALKGVLARSANWVEFRQGEEGTVDVDASPPVEVVKDVATLPEWPEIPKIRGIVQAPIFARTGETMTTPGYHEATRLWYAPDPKLDIPTVPQNPTEADIADARTFLLEELLGDFRFGDQASRAHIVALLLLPFVRPMIEGPTPLHLVDAPTEGTGKTLLVKVITRIFQGHDAPAIPEAESDGEWRKRITAALVEGRSILHLDNLNEMLNSGALASALTTETWSDRLLGVSKMVQVKNRAVWIGTGNNMAVSKELTRRILWCRLDAKVERPSERTGFRHPRLIAWVQESRGRLIAAAMTLVQAWIARGQPLGSQTMGMYESWVEIIGGILDVADIPGLLENRTLFVESQKVSVDDWPAFLKAWWNAFAGKPVGVADLFRLVTRDQLLDSVVGDGGERSQRIRLGCALQKHRDRVQNEFQVRQSGRDHKDRPLYQLHRQAMHTREDIQDTLGR